MKKILIIAGLVIVIGILVIANVLKKDKGTEVSTQKVEQGTVIQKVTGSGQLEPAVEVKVSANVSGKILKLYADEGDSVRKGQLLVELDREQYVANLQKAESGLLSAIANEKQTKSELDRSEKLYNQKLLSDADYEAVEARYKASEAQRMQMEASRDEARDQLSKTRLYSTMNGIVTKLNKEEGEIALGATFQEDVIMVVSDLSTMESVIEVDENEVVNISIGDTASVELDAFPDTTFKGKVTKIANSAVTKGLGTQEQITNFEVTVTLVNANKEFRPGMSTTVDVFTKREDNVLRVPIQAVTVREKKRLQKKTGIEEHPETKSEKTESDEPAKDENVDVVFVIEDNKAVAKPVKIGISDDTHYAVLSGLKEGDKVITGPFGVLSRTLNNGDLVREKEGK